MFRKKIPWMILFLVLMVCSIWAVVSRSGSYSPTLLRETLCNANPWWLVAAVVGMLCNVLFEGAALDFLIKALTKTDDGAGHPIRPHGLLYSAADIYFSAITPSASAGQPASAFFMRRDGIPVAQSAVILVLNMLLYTGALVLVGVMGFMLCPDIYYGMDTLAQILILIGFIFLLGLCTVFVLVLKKEQWVKHMGVALISLGAKLHLIRHKQSKIDKIELAIRQYKTCSDLIHKNKSTIAVAFLFNFLQRLALVSTTVLVYLAFGGSVSNLAEVTGVQCLVLVGVYSLPIPGGMGVADYLLISGLCQIEDVVSPANLELISRGISFYSCIGLTIIIVVVGYILQKKRMRRHHEAEHEANKEN
ncbi:MAG: flippase-like domain-containing protein [Clostridiales bacterium]|nr:flippase-like domain-containing protein [Clostridiales bacterium]